MEAVPAEEAGQAEEPEQARAAGPALEGEVEVPLSLVLEEQEDRSEEEW